MPGLIPPFAIRTVGLMDRRPWHSTPGTRVDDWMLTVFLGGRGWYQHHGGTVLVVGGMLGLVPPIQPGILAADPDDPYIHWYCRFNGAHACHLADGILASRGGVRFAQCAQTASIADRLRAVAPIHRTDLPERMGSAEVALAGILVGLSGSEEHRDEGKFFTAESLEDHLRRNLDQPTDLEAIARHFQVSVRTLTRRCSAWTGRSVQRWHEQMKMTWAADLLASTEISVSEVAQRSGYRDPAYFSRVYRRHHGHPPSRRSGGSDP
ncbi:hypothetical protein LBMAG53_24570 [Planctomycetota bacterium]|nr:hypothetical protein LBMAG53_24570 [Planctomycetota bacterium]